MNVFALGFFDQSQASVLTTEALQSLMIDNKPANLKWVYSDFVDSEYTGYYGTAQAHKVGSTPTIIILGEYQVASGNTEAKYIEVDRLQGQQSAQQIRAAILKQAQISAPSPINVGSEHIEAENPDGDGIRINTAKCPKWMPKLACNRFGMGGFGSIVSIIVIIILLLLIYKFFK